MPGPAASSESDDALAREAQKPNLFFTRPSSSVLLGYEVGKVLPPRLGLGWSRSHGSEDGRCGKALQREAIADAARPDIVCGGTPSSYQDDAWSSELDRSGAETHTIDAISLGPKRFDKQPFLYSRTFRTLNPAV